MRICVIASCSFPIAEPFAGGLEAWTHGLVGALHERGHDVSLFAAPGSDPALPVRTLPVPAFTPSPTAMADVYAPSERWLREHHAYLGLMLDLARHGGYDVVHNSSLHHLPVAMASALPMPMLTTLHTPPLPWLESATALAVDHGVFVAVSDFTARQWDHIAPTVVVRNGVDVRSYHPGPGGGPAVWSGRLVPEKAPHLAIDAARAAGVELVLAGPASDPVYVAREVTPRLGPDVRYVGHLRTHELVPLLGAASVALVTPEWEEPYGLVAAEAMACGTPVAAIARGALPQLVVPGVGALAAPDDPDGLAEAVRVALRCDRAAVRAHAERHCSLERMVDDYERLYRSLVTEDVAA